MGNPTVDEVRAQLDALEFDVAQGTVSAMQLFTKMRYRITTLLAEQAKAEPVDYADALADFIHAYIREAGGYTNGHLRDAIKAFKPSPVVAPQGVVVELIDAAKFASDVLAELYAKYQLKIGPYASQAQLANVKLRYAIKAAPSPAEGSV